MTRSGRQNDDDPWHEETQNNLLAPLQLTAGEYLTELNGLSFARLPTSLKLNLRRARVQIFVLKRETHRYYKYEVFKRLNRGGSILAEQELRNCAVRLIGNTFPDLIRELGADDNFQKATGLNANKISASYGDELVLRFFAMKNGAELFKHDVSAYLTAFMEAVARQDVKFDYTKEKSIFLRTWKTIARVTEAQQLFRAQRLADGAYTGTLSPTLFEVVSVAVAKHLEVAEGVTPEALRTILDQIKASAGPYTGSGSNSKRKTLKRVEIAGHDDPWHGTDNDV